jgi:UrcA family protein
MFAGTSRGQDGSPRDVNHSEAPSSAAPTTIEVEAPRLLKFETRPTNGTLRNVSLEGPVSYADLDLRTNEGVAELRSRIAHKAADICAHLSELYPVYARAGASCVNDAIETATIRANRLVTQARQASY